jgi:hypothetical protein
VLVASALRTDLATLLGVTVLGWERRLVEIEAVAAVLDP